MKKKFKITKRKLDCISHTERAGVLKQRKQNKGKEKKLIDWR